jgi:hypothetical protein
VQLKPLSRFLRNRVEKTAASGERCVPGMFMKDDWGFVSTVAYVTGAYSFCCQISSLRDEIFPIRNKA